MFHTVPVDREEEPPFLGPGEGLDSTSVAVSGPVFDLEKHGHPVFFRDDIDFSSFRCDEVGLQNIVFVPLEVLDGDELRPIAGFTVWVRYSHWGKEKQNKKQAHCHSREDGNLSSISCVKNEVL